MTMSEVLQVPAITKILPTNYEFVAYLGEGGSGAVFKVREKKSATELALKMLRPQFLSDTDSLARFEEEARIASKLNHPNIAAVFDYGVTEKGAPYIAMEMLSGKSLEQIIQEQGTLSVPRALDLFTQLCDAIECAHSAGIVHRDIKPSNIIVREVGSGVEIPKLVDFGLAKTSLNSTNSMHSSEFLGSPLYMSPEQCEGEDVDARTDIYALGCTIHEALSGAPPFVGRTPVDTILHHMRSDAPDLFDENASIPPSLSDTVRKCLEKDPEKRFQTVRELKERLEEEKLSINALVTKKEADKAAALSVSLASAAVSEQLARPRYRAPFGLSWLSVLALVTFGIFSGITASVCYLEYVQSKQIKAGADLSTITATSDSQTDFAALLKLANEYEDSGRSSEAIRLLETAKTSAEYAEYQPQIDFAIGRIFLHEERGSLDQQRITDKKRAAEMRDGETPAGETQNSGE